MVCVGPSSTRTTLFVITCTYIERVKLSVNVCVGVSVYVY